MFKIEDFYQFVRPELLQHTHDAEVNIEEFITQVVVPRCAGGTDVPEDTDDQAPNHFSHFHEESRRETAELAELARTLRQDHTGTLRVSELAEWVSQQPGLTNGKHLLLSLALRHYVPTPEQTALQQLDKGRRAVYLASAYHQLIQELLAPKPPEN